VSRWLEKWWALLLFGAVALAMILFFLVGRARAADDNWSRREPGDQRGWCAGRYDPKRGANFGPCPGYYVWTKYGAGGPHRNYADAPGDPSASAPASGGTAAPSPTAVAPAPAPPAPVSPGAPSPGHGGGPGGGHGGHGGGHGGGKGR